MNAKLPQPRGGSIVLSEATVHAIVTLIALSLGSVVREEDEVFAGP